jgi:hypothetical protein
MKAGELGGRVPVTLTLAIPRAVHRLTPQDNGLLLSGPCTMPLQTRTGIARSELMKGFRWLFRGKEMGVSMLRSGVQMLYRSQAPERELDSTGSQTHRSIRIAVVDYPELTERPQFAIWAPPP